MQGERDYVQLKMYCRTSGKEILSFDFKKEASKREWQRGNAGFWDKKA
jgi:hypothetical protein